VVERCPAILLLCLSIAGSASPAAAAGGPRVTYAGPAGNVTGPVTLTAKASGNGARIAAVTFVVDGAPRGSDTSAPFPLGLNPALVRGGRHTDRVVAGVRSAADRAPDGAGRASAGARPAAGPGEPLPPAGV